MAGSSWNHESDRDFLLTIIEGGQLKGIKWDVIAATLQAKGYTFSKEACRQHFQKLRKESSLGLSSTPSSRANAPTPRKRAVSGSSKSKLSKSAKSADRSLTTIDDDDDEEDIEMQTPSKNKKMKTEDGVVRKLFKVEELGENENGSAGGVIDLDGDELYDDDDDDDDAKY
ncbi:hypothetical protein B7494_g8070 [Chlorociboria aeruginascens]|nr:hypothetical protein B7494_g8070 [Chlorociboria aeruginascens]